MSSSSPNKTGPRAVEAPLTIDELVGYFRSGAKDRSQFRIGIEQEKIGARDDGRPVPYDSAAGEAGLAELLGRMEGSGFQATREDGHAIALSRGGDRITMEPGGQL